MKINRQKTGGATPVVSVITPFFDRKQLFPDLLSTLREQTFADFELIIVDDGSRDGLAHDVAAARAPFPIRFFRFPENRGAASARNAGIEAATGQYVAFLDSDDAWHPEKLKLQLGQLEKASTPHLVSLTRQFIRGTIAHIAPRRLMTEQDDVGSYLFLQGGIIQSSMMMLRRELAARVRFEEGSRGHDDWSFALRLQSAGARFAMLGQPLTIYDDTGGRLRRSPTYSAARLGWLGQRRAQLGEAPYWAAVAAVASHLRQSEQVRPVELIMAARRSGAISAARTAYYLAAWAVPPIRNIARVSRHRWAKAPELAPRREPEPYRGDML